MPSLARLRQQAALSQAELAEKAGVGRATISRLELGGNASYETIERLAKALKKKRTDLTKKARQGRPQNQEA